ncbi:amino acid adenylation domain-containing protein, partial [Longimicrobium sp.]|uniref:non-ribosomal peptide synthetase n=1 Tax=Longimicrobium sp. TaxID=2029185 RepID=UPI002F927EF3
MPTDRPRPARQDHAGALAGMDLGDELSAGLRALSRRHGTTLHMTLLAGWGAVLGRLAGQDDVVVGTPSANRGRREIEALIGFFVNTLALRIELGGSPSVSDLLRRTKERALEAQHHQDIPFEQVVELVQPVRTLAHSPLFQVMFGWQNASEDGLQLPGLSLGGVAVGGGAASRPVAKFDLSLTLGEAGGRIGGSLVYATSLFEQATVERHLAYLRKVLEAFVADDLQAVDALPLLPDAERRLVVEEWSRTEAASPSEVCIHELFAAQARLTPGAAALVHADQETAYAELDARANRLAHHLRSLGVGPEARVAVFLEWGPELVVALLAVLKAGGVYVPLDPSLPDERLAFMADDAGVAALVTRDALAGRLTAGVTVRVDADAERIAAESGEVPASGVAPEGLAYLIYTSGSTGRPKGVAVEHRAAAAHFRAMAGALEIVREDRVLQFASSGFDVSLEQVFNPLLSGATLVLRGAELWSPAEFAARARSLGVTVANLPPAYWQEVLATGALPDVRLLLVGGDALPVSAAAAGDATRLLNGYGPTEAVVTATAFTVPGGFAEGFAGSTAPIGRPIPGHDAYILDSRGAPVPLGVAGELFLGGLLARGYLARPGLTAERFVPDPFGGEPGARLYRTGDRARWLADGTIEFLGRIDFQVKVRGFRIELGEIEARLREHPSVREAVVAAREVRPGDTRLVAYVVEADPVEADALRAHLSERLPEYMVPAAYVRLYAFPLTPSGKVDRKALPAPDGDAFATRGYEAPVGETEQVLAEVWSELLGVERVGRWDNFFELGGHSLLAVRVISRVRQVLGAEVGIGDLFERPVLADLAQALATAGPSALPAIEPADRSAPLPLSFAQQRLWFVEQLGNLGSTYHVPLRQRLRGELDGAALARALDRIVARHEALRTVFAEVDGVPEQRIPHAGETHFRLVEHDLRDHPQAGAELQRLMMEESGAPFDLARGPLIRGRLARLAEYDYVLLVTMHHIVSDGWSMGVFTRELGALYDAFRRGEPDPLPALPIQYADYAVWQRRWVEGEVLREQAEYWTQALAGAPELLELPTDHARPLKQDFSGGVVNLALNEELTASLKAFGQRHGATLFMTLLAGWAAVLGRLSGQDDVVIGTPTANRGRSEIEGLIGFFVNTLALRVNLSESPTGAALLAQVRERALGAQQNQDIPFEQVVELVRPARSLSHTPLFQVLFAWQNAPENELELSGLGPASGRGAPAPAAQAGAPEQTTAKFDLSLSLLEKDGRIAGVVTYASALFERATVERFVGYLRLALEAMVADESQPVDRLEIVRGAERRLVLEEWNATGRAYPTDGFRVHDLFRVQAARTPEAIALSWRGERWTYAELERRANQIANALRRRGVGPEVRVGICLPRTPDLVAAMLGVLGAGGAYVPLDPAYPRERLGYMAEDAAITLVITDSAVADRLPEGADALLLDRERDAIAAESAEPFESGVVPENLSHVIFTSGSTGRPKGVMIRHSSVVVLLHWLRENVTDEERSSVLFSTSINFDVSIAEMFGTLAWGGKLVLVENALELATVDEDVVHVSMVPSAAAELLRGGGIPACVKTLNLGGEALPNALAQGLYALDTVQKVGNLYGPTEDTTYSTYHVVPRGADQVLVGAPVANTQAYVLDAHLQPVPVGVTGELYLAGDGLSRGYANHPAMTAERFVPCPFGAPGARMYRVMDRVRRRADGEIEYLGRIDFQVKVRGYRIELGEIEARLAEHPGVRAPVVLVREDAPGDRRLMAYYLADEAVAVDALRAHLTDRLPEYMVPAAYVWMDAYPLTPNGKVDRRALPAPEGDAYSTGEYAAPVGETEQALGGIWAEVLGVERVGRHDNFFELGGHSLLAVRVISRMRQVLDAEVGIGDLFERPVLADLARTIENAGRTELPPIERVDRTGRLPLSFAQQRLWFLEQFGNLGDTYHVPMRRRLEGELDGSALRRALDAIVARHEALRTTFVEMDGEPVQRIAEESRFHLVEHDLSGHPDAAAELRRLSAEEANARFDLEHGPLIRGRLVRLGEHDHVLLMTMHHIVSDGWSMEVLTREMGTLYEAFRRGESNPLAPLPVQYADYAAWQRKWVAGEVLRQQAEYWTQTLAGAPELLELPTDHPRPVRQDHAGSTVGISLDEDLSAALKELSRRHGATLFMAVLAGWAAVLRRISGQDDVVVGTPTANRGRTEIEGLIGFFVNTLALRVDLSESPTVAELLEQVRAASLGAQQHQDIPFEQVVELVQPARSMSHSPLFQVMFAWQNASEGRPELPGRNPEGVSPAATAKFDLSLSLGEAGERIAGSLTYATSLFERATIERHLAYLRRVLQAMAADDVQPVDALPLLPDAERRLVVEEWNATGAAYPRDLCIHELVQAQAARAPDAVAVVFDAGELTYAELNERANRLAHHLAGHGVGPDARVAICVERGPEMMVGLLAILKAGGGYVPLDPGYPAERLRYMLHDSAPVAVLTQGSLDGVQALFAGLHVPVIDLQADDWARGPATNPARAGLTPGHLAYVIYTSGSTGTPKGVMIEHRSLANHTAWQAGAFG